MELHPETVQGLSIGQGAKKPFKSKIKSVVWLENALIAPVVVGTMAALETMLASYEFSVETNGCAWTAGHKVR